MTEEPKAPQLDLGKMTALLKQQTKVLPMPNRSPAFAAE